MPIEGDIQLNISDLRQKLNDTAEKKKIILEFLEKSIQKYFDLTHSMGVYQDYKVSFDVGKKTLKLRKADEILSRAVIGSKSNYMFLHLCLFLGIHEHLIIQQVKFVPQFLILDQPSQPYLENQSADFSTGLVDNDDDRVTIKDAFALLNRFITEINQKDEDFQIILLEHASKDYWENPLLENFHLVDEFRNGKGLIPFRATIKCIDESQSTDPLMDR